MKTSRLIVSAAVSLIAFARAAEIDCVYPTGGALGTTFDVSVRGQGLKTASGASSRAPA